MAQILSKTDLFHDLQTKIEQHCTVVKKVFQPLEMATLSQQPTPKEWHILQCFDHLNLTHHYYRPKVEQALADATSSQPQADLYKPSFWGRIYMHFSFNPKYSFPAAAKITPDATLDKGVLDAYLTKQTELHALIDKSLQIDLIKTKVALEKGVKFNLGDCLKVLVYHDELHINQAHRVLAAIT